MNNIIYLILTILGAFFGFYKKGKSAGKEDMEAKINKKLLKEIENADKINNEVDSLSDSELDARLRKFTKRSGE